MENGKNKKVNHAQDFFLYLLVFLELTFLAIGSGSILFQFVNRFLPDKIVNTFDQGSVRFGIAAIFIATPIFFLISIINARRISNGVTAIDSGVRRWLTYIVLFFASATAVGDLIALIFNFLNGETTIKFFLKVLVILVIAGGIFAYYFWDMRKVEIDRKRIKMNRLAAFSAAGFLAVVFVGAFFIIDSPGLAREKRIDEQTINDIQSIDSSVRGFFSQTRKLPEALADLDKTGFSPNLQSENKVEYSLTGENTYNLCSSFARSDVDDKDVSFGISNSGEWKHAAGNVCFERIVLNEKVPIGETK